MFNLIKSHVTIIKLLLCNASRTTFLNLKHENKYTSFKNNKIIKKASQNRILYFSQINIIYSKQILSLK